MAKIQFNSTKDNQGGSGWEPLPEGDYILQVDAVEQKVSGNKNPQLQISCHVADGPHAGAKCTIWQSLVPKAAWSLEILLRALLDENEYEATETGEVRTRTVKGQQVEEPIYTFEFDTDDMIGREAMFEVTQEEYNGKVNNRFNNPRPVLAEEAPAPAKPAPVTTRAAAPAQRAAAPVATPPAATAQRRRAQA